MNLLDFKQSTSYFTKKKPVVVLLFLFSLVCLTVSIQSGSVFIHSFLSGYIESPAWFWCYLVAIAIDVVLFFLCTQLFSDIFVGLDNKKRYLDLPTLLLFLAFLALSMFISIKGADLRKSHHTAQIMADNKTIEVIDQIGATIHKEETTPIQGITRQERKAIEGKAELQKARAASHQNLVSAIELHHEQQQHQVKSISEMLDFSKTVVILFQFLLILCSACSEYMKSKRDSEVKSVEKEATKDTKKIIPINTPTPVNDKRVTVQGFNKETPNDIATLAKRLRNEGLSYSKIGDRLDVSKGKAWKLVNEK